MKNELVKIPTLAELMQETPESEAQNALTVILNQEPPQKWLCNHPMATVKDSQNKTVPLLYLPINRVEYLLTKIYRKWSVEVKTVQTIANSVVVTVRLHVTNPLTGDAEFQDGVGAAPIQTDKDAGAMDWNFAKANGVQIATPAAETYAIKDAAEKFGKVFGRDLGRRDTMDYTSLLTKSKSSATFEDVQMLYDMKKGVLSKDEIEFSERIIKNKEEKSYNNLRQLLMDK